MRLVLVCLFALVSLACGETFVEPNAFDYHQQVGIKEAERIRDAEIQMQSLQAGAGRIVGGSMSSPFDHPHLCGLIIDLIGILGNSVCGSSMLTSNRLLTAAHCWFDGRNQAWQFTAVLGSQTLFTGGGQRVPTTQVIMHPEWWPSTLTNDVAMIYLPYNIPFSNQISPVSLPTGNMLWEDFNGNIATASGYGKTGDNNDLTFTNTITHRVDKQVITNAMCSLTYGTAVIQPSTLCTSGAGGASICGGDSGGPLVVYRNGVPTLIGVCSFVAANGCQLGHPSGFARVTSFNNFIHSHLF